MLEGREREKKNFMAADAETEQDRSRQAQEWSTPKLPRWEEGRGSELTALRPSILQARNKIGAQLVSGWHYGLAPLSYSRPCVLVRHPGPACPSDEAPRASAASVLHRKLQGPTGK